MSFSLAYSLIVLTITGVGLWRGIRMRDWRLAIAGMAIAILSLAWLQFTLANM